VGKWRRNLSLPRRWQRNHLISKYGAVCYLCQEPIAAAKDITFDHWLPLSKGGIDDLDNYRLAHLDCNQLKGNLEPDEFRAFQIGQIQWEDK
jgi:5-methylcytosine-specific restriction endonuclease McrA